MRPRRIGNSIITRILLLGVAIVICGTILRYFILSGFLRTDIGELAASQQLALANYVAHDIDYKIAERKQVLERMAATLPQEGLRRPAELREWLALRQQLLPLFSVGLMVLDPAGRTIADFPHRAERAEVSYAGRDYFRAALAGHAYIGKPVIGYVAHEPVLPMAVPVVDRSGKVVAVLAGVTALAAPGFLDLLQQSRIGRSGSFLLISPRDQLFVAAGEPDMVLKPTPPRGVNLLHDRAMAGFRGTGMTVNARNVEEVSAIVSVPSAGWFVVARLPTSEALAPVDRVQRFIITYSWPAMLVFVVVAWTGLFLTFRPLFRAADHADRMTRGDSPLQPLPIARNDEVGHLTAAFNRLLAKLWDSRTELDRMAHHDQLTGLPNRLLLADRLQQALERARRNHTSLAVLCLDLDHFKPINDTLGHDAGDEALRQVAQRLVGTVRADDTLARVGGDEFVIVLADIPAGEARKAARVVAEACIAAMAPPFVLGAACCRMGVSVGGVAADGTATQHDLLLAADRALYRAKNAGRGTYMQADDIGRPHGGTAPDVAGMMAG